MLADVDAGGASAASRMVPLERLLPGMPCVSLDEAGRRRRGTARGWRAADLVVGRPRRQPQQVRLLDDAGRLLGIAEREPGGLLHPVVVLV